MRLSLRLRVGMVMLVVVLGLWFYGRQTGAFTMPQEVRIPAAPGQSPSIPRALFSHWSHDQYRCYSCHPSLFPKQLVSFTHQEMDRGRYCGHCHNGQQTHAIKKMQCAQCHVPE